MMTYQATNNKHPDEAADKIPRWFVFAWLILLLLIAAYIRVHGADYYTLTADEAIIRNMAKGDSISQVWQFSHYEAPAPLANIIRYYWMTISQEPAYLRSLSLLFGLATILIYYRIGTFLGGRLPGMACAALIAFSHGCIIQSYIVRNYAIFTFFLSLGFWQYLSWRSHIKTRSLLAYGASQCLAVLCNISAVFAVACIFPVEAVRLWRAKASWHTQLIWTLTNSFVLMTAAIVYILWIPLLLPLKSYFKEFLVAPGAGLSFAINYPFAAASYMLASHLFAALMFLCALPFALMRMRRDYSFIYSLLGIALLLAIALGVSNFYPYLGTRRSLWELPFVITASSLMISQTYRHFLTATTRTQMIAAAAFLLLGFVFYSPAERFGDGTEYALSQAAWDDANRALNTFTSSDIIVTERDDGALLANLYTPLGQEAFTGSVMAKTTPYRELSILYNPYYPRFYSMSVFLTTLEQAQRNGLLDKTDRVIFFNTAWSRSPVAGLMLCAELDKTVITFPKWLESKSLTRKAIHSIYISMTIISKKALIEDILASNGKVRQCLNTKYDMVPGFLP